MSTQSGSKTLDWIDDSLGKARGELQSVDAEFGNARAKLAALRQQQIGLYARLAKLRLTAIERGSLVDALDAADKEAGKILDERKLASAALEDKIKAAEAALAEDEKRRADQQAVVAGASEAVDKAEAEAQAALAADEAYQTQLGKTEQSDFTADQAEAKAASAHSDRNDKGRPYEADPLFSYLWARGYGTSKYRAWPLARWLDRKVAKLSGYEEARRNYALLIEIPERLDEHAATMRSAFDHEAEALATLEQQAANAAEVPKLTTSLEAAEKQLAEIDAAIAAREDTIRGLVAERKAYASGEDDLYQRSIGVLSQALERESFDLLRERAARTQDPEDDDIVRELVALDTDVDRLEQNLTEFQRLHERQNDRLEKLEDVRRRFKAARYDDPLSEFANAALIALVLKQFLSGAAGSADVWRTIRRQQRTRRVHRDPNFGSLKFPRGPAGSPWRMPPGGLGHHGGGFGGFKPGGGFGGGGFKTGGGFRGGGFKTGGGF